MTRGYHCPPIQQPHNNTVSYDHMKDDILLEMIDHAYERIVAAFPKYSQRELRGTEE